MGISLTQTPRDNSFYCFHGAQRCGGNYTSTRIQDNTQARAKKSGAGSKKAGREAKNQHKKHMPRPESTIIATGKDKKHQRRPENTKKASKQACKHKKENKDPSWSRICSIHSISLGMGITISVGVDGLRLRRNIPQRKSGQVIEARQPRIPTLEPVLFDGRDLAHYVVAGGPALTGTGLIDGVGRHSVEIHGVGFGVGIHPLDGLEDFERQVFKLGERLGRGLHNVLKDHPLNKKKRGSETSKDWKVELVPDLRAKKLLKRRINLPQNIVADEEVEVNGFGIIVVKLHAFRRRNKVGFRLSQREECRKVVFADVVGDHNAHVVDDSGAGCPGEFVSESFQLLAKVIVVGDLAVFEKIAPKLRALDRTSASAGHGEIPKDAHLGCGLVAARIIKTTWVIKGNANGDKECVVKVLIMRFRRQSFVVFRITRSLLGSLGGCQHRVGVVRGHGGKVVCRAEVVDER